MKKRKSNLTGSISFLLALSLVNQMAFPTVAFALTGGPSQPEVQSFEPIGTTQMVDPFSGDFVYNIPLMDVDGYPLNISYHSGIGMDQEASWVGLGWNLNVGNISRNMRGLPDDFDGMEDAVVKEQNIQKNFTIGVGIDNTFEFVGIPLGGRLKGKFGFGFGTNFFYNNYKGMGVELSTSTSTGMSATTQNKIFSAGPNLNAQLTLNSQEGIGYDQSASLSGNISKSEKRQLNNSLSFGSHYNTRAGIKERTLGFTASYSQRFRNMKRPISAGSGSSATIPVGDQSYVPQVNMPMSNSSFSGSTGFGPEAFWGSYLFGMSITYSKQELAKNKQEQPAYGYLFSNDASKDKKALYDINREKDGEYTPQLPMLPVTNFTYDVFSVTGQGLGGIYRPYRNDKGVVGDPLVEENGNGGHIGSDIAIAAYFKGGLKGGYNSSKTESGKWDDGSSASVQGILKFNEKDKNSPQYEPYYFKAAGELTPINDHYYDDMDGDKPVAIDVTKGGNANSEFSNGEKIKSTKINKRQARNQAISVLNAEQATAYGFDKKIKSYTLSNDGSLQETITNRIDSKHKKHHISEITTYRTDGARYIYGIPVYNTTQKEVTFNISKKNGILPDVDRANGNVKYESNDNSIENNRGFDHYYSSTTLAPYAHSYLLTTVLSPDYIDRTGDGPTDDDFGTYTKFNYKKQSGSYHWRTPYGINSASFDEGFKTDPYDDKANYVYGEKEMWYLQSITSKTMVAEFSLSPRNDGKDVADENGGPGSGVSLKLDKISLYTKCERQSKGVAAVPLQEVHFVYDKKDHLCPQVPNNNSSVSETQKGKLTLEEIYFTYQNSVKGKLSPYKFNYSSFNPPYAGKATDRWGNYKENNLFFPNDEFPYSEQDKTIADRNAAAWTLSGISLPSGGRIHVDYEADDYAFVQDKRAMEMFNVTGVGNAADKINSVDRLYENGKPNNFIKIALPVPVKSPQDFINKYLKEDPNKGAMDTVFFRFSVALIGRNVGGPEETLEKEYVSGYAEMGKDCGVYGPMAGDGTYKEAYIKLKDVRIGDRKNDMLVNPISRTAWQIVRLYFGKFLHPGSGKAAPGKESFASIMTQFGKSFLGIFQDIIRNHEGVNHGLYSNGYGQIVALNGKSRVRLYSPLHKKIGGGSRVKRIQVLDNWRDMADNADASTQSFGQIYEYTKVLEENGETTLISSGVADNEPMIGGEENPLHQPLAYTVENWMIPDNSSYVETPVGESFYPGASVGYSEIKVKSINAGSGYIKHEFYTAKDFPVVTEHTIVERKNDKPNILLALLKFKTELATTASQGHVIKLNNMHGQKKATWVYGENQTEPISGQEFSYSVKSRNAKELDNQITAIDKKGKVKKITVGKESDFVADMRKYSSESWSLDIEVEVDVSPTPAFGIPIPLISVVPRYASASSNYKSATVTKVITSYGILEKVVSYDLGSYVSSENLAYDAETGEVLLTKTENNFNDPIYSFNYPAHWSYDQMGMAYKNLGISLENVIIKSGKVELTDKSKEFFVKGDEVVVAGSNKQLWVNEVKISDENSWIKLIDRAGEPAADASNVSLTIVRSGRKNMQSIPVGAITMLKNPLPMDGDDNKLSFEKILAANAIEYSDNWVDYCECGVNNGKMGEVVDQGSDPDSDLKPGFIPHGNYFVQGAAGNWKVKRNYVYLSPRNYSSENRNVDVRNDGTYTDFDSFWKSNDGRDWKANKSKWAWATEVTKMNPNGYELENRDSLNNFSSAIFGYSNTLPVAVAQNSRYKEIGVDNFEDYYSCTTCGTTPGNEDHWSFKNNIDKVVSTTAHTGKRSIKITPHSKASIGKKIVCRDAKLLPPD